VSIIARTLELVMDWKLKRLCKIEIVRQRLKVKHLHNESTCQRTVMCFHILSIRVLYIFGAKTPRRETVINVTICAISTVHVK